MNFIFILFFFILGILIGSFLNVVIYRYNTGKGIGGRSMCLSCGKTLEWLELIPVLSFFLQGRKCKGCKSKISWQYFLVEIFTALIFALTAEQFITRNVLNVQTLILFFLALISWSILVVIFVYDMKHKIIPDSLVFTFAGISLLGILVSGHITLAHILAGPILFIPFYLLWFVSGGRWIGLGDGKLALGIGWMLGLSLGLSAIVLAFWIGAVVSLIMLVILRLKPKSKKLTMKSEIPFAPYLIFGLALVYFLQIDVVGVRLLFGS